MKLIQTDVRHDCRSRMWYCSNCKEDFCMGEQPEFCPMCGEKVTEVKLKDDPEPDTLRLHREAIERRVKLIKEREENGQN